MEEYGLTKEEAEEALTKAKLAKLSEPDKALLVEIRMARNELDHARKRMDYLQSQCKHPEVMRRTKAGSNTGNYDPSADSYWTDHDCELCGKHWTIFG